MLFHGGMVVIHQSFGTPRVIYSLRNRLERNLIHSELNVKRKKGISTYQLLVPKKDARQAKELLKHYKWELEQA